MLKNLKINRIMCLTVCCFFAMFAMQSNVKAEMTQEKYESSDVFEIKTAEELLEISEIYEKETSQNFAGKTIKLMSDIDLEEKNICPIGNANCAFGGIFDGQGYTIKNFSVTDSSLYFSGLFGVTYFAEIRNLNVENVTVVGCSAVGGLIGESIFSNVINCSAKNVDLSLTGEGENVYVGGLLGLSTANTVGYYDESYDYSDPSSLVEGCTATGKITLNNFPKSICAGGLIGLNRAVSDYSKVQTPCSAIVKNSSANVDIQGAQGVTGNAKILLTAIGGFVGLNHDTNGTAEAGTIIDGCKAEGTVSGGITRYMMYVGGFAGANSGYCGNSVIRNSYSTGNVDGGSVIKVFDTEGALYVGGFVGGVNTATTVPTGFEDSMKQSSENQMKSSRVYNCYTTSDVVKGKSANAYTGGFSGVCEALNGETFIINCYAANGISAASEGTEDIEVTSDYVGGLVGGTTSTEDDSTCKVTVEASYWNRDLSGIKDGIGKNDSSSSLISVEGLTEGAFSSESGLLKKLNNNVNTYDAEGLWSKWTLDRNQSKYPVFASGDSAGSNGLAGDISKGIESLMKLATGEGFPRILMISAVVFIVSLSSLICCRKKSAVKILKKKG